jgi:hypothetical protein
MNSPNPTIQRELKELMEHFLWDWPAFNETYRVVSVKE